MVKQKLIQKYFLLTEVTDCLVLNALLQYPTATRLKTPEASLNVIFATELYPEVETTGGLG